MSITEFLEARIAEDEVSAKRFLSGQPGTQDAEIRAQLVLKDCEAKRNILEAHREHGSELNKLTGDHHLMNVGIYSGLESTIVFLARSYSGHPDFCAEWTD